MSSWDEWVEQTLSRLESMKILRSLRPIHYLNHPVKIEPETDHAFQVLDDIHQWDRASVEIEILESTFQRWVEDVSSSGDDLSCGNIPGGELGLCQKPSRKLLLFSGNDYLGLSSHPMVAKAATKDCLLCPTGFSANMAFMTVVGYIGSLSVVNKTSSKDGVAIFSDALNHASIIDGIRLAERQGRVQVFIYRHCDMAHLNGLLSTCTIKKKVVVTDGLFSMDGDFAPMTQPSKLRKKHNFLLVVDDQKVEAADTIKGPCLYFFNFYAYTHHCCCTCCYGGGKEGAVA